MKRIIFGFAIMIFVLSISVVYVINNNDSNKIYETDNSKDFLKNENNLTMMLETGYNTYEYEETIADKWPGAEYVFNESLSKCENGGTVSWNDDTKKIVMKGNISDKCYIYFDINSVNLASYIADELYVDDGINGLYYHDGQGTYTNANQEAGDNSYRFSGGDYKLTSKALSEGYENLYTSIGSEGIIDFYCDGSKSFIGNYCTASSKYYSLNYDGSKHYDTLLNALDKLESDGYITRDEIKNFVCFGPESDEEFCPLENLYRVIGVFDGKAKLIKYDYINTSILGTDGDYNPNASSTFYSGKRFDNNVHYWYYWSGNSSNKTWDTTNLNLINLNTNYYNYLGNNWQNKIDLTVWIIGGNTTKLIRSSNAKSVFQNEIINPAEMITYQDEIGLMYVSDYMYAASPANWLTVGYNTDYNDYRNVISENWMYMGDYDWTITHSYDNTLDAFYVDNIGSVFSGYADGGHAVRPAFYLKSDVAFIGGTGTETDPYRIV